MKWNFDHHIGDVSPGVTYSDILDVAEEEKWQVGCSSTTQLADSQKVLRPNLAGGSGRSMYWVGSATQQA